MLGLIGFLLSLVQRVFLAITRFACGSCARRAPPSARSGADSRRRVVILGGSFAGLVRVPDERLAQPRGSESTGQRNGVLVVGLVGPFVSTRACATRSFSGS